MRCAERLALGRRRRRADQHAVAAGAVDFLDDQLVQVREHVVALLGDVGMNVGTLCEDRLLAEVEADHLRHVRIDRLVVGDAGADRVGERHAARRDTRRTGPGTPSIESGAERERVEEVVVDAPVDHVHALRPARRRM